jgi:hypothetical protein
MNITAAAAADAAHTDVIMVAAVSPLFHDSEPLFQYFLLFYEQCFSGFSMT